MTENSVSQFFRFENKKLVVLISVILILITLLTKYSGSTDVGDYAGSAKYFAGKLNSDIRSSHSYLYGYVHAPFVKIFNSLIIFKITSLIFLFLIIISCYFISNRDKRAFWLVLCSPVLWYMAPWINPIQLASLFFLWAYYFIKEYRETEKIKFMLLSGIFVGLSWASWDALVFFAPVFALSFFYDRKLHDLIIFCIFILIGLLPKLAFDQVMLGFAFSGIMRYFFGVVTAVFFKGIYGEMPGFIIVNTILVLIFLPLYTYKLFLKDSWRNNKNLTIFLFLSIFLLIENSQIRYVLLLVPIIIIELVPILDSTGFKRQIAFSAVLILFILTPYAIQIETSTNAEEFQSFVLNLNKIKTFENPDEIMKNDLMKLEKDFANKTFVVGNKYDDYYVLSHLYWGDNIIEFVSIQDYQIYFNDSFVIFERRFMPVPIIKERRQIWIAGGLNKNENDDTDFNSIDLAIGIGEPIKLDNFNLVKKYDILYISEKQV